MARTLERDSCPSESTSPREYAVPKVDIITSFAANPPTRAIFVRQSLIDSFDLQKIFDQNLTNQEMSSLPKL